MELCNDNQLFLYILLPIQLLVSLLLAEHFVLHLTVLWSFILPRRFTTGFRLDSQQFYTYIFLFSWELSLVGSMCMWPSDSWPPHYPFLLPMTAHIKKDCTLPGITAKICTGYSLKPNVHPIYTPTPPQSFPVHVPSITSQEWSLHITKHLSLDVKLIPVTEDMQSVIITYHRCRWRGCLH